MFTVEQLLSIAKEKKASDVHVNVGLPPRVFFFVFFVFFVFFFF